MTNLLIPLEHAIFPGGREPHQRLLGAISTIAVLTQVGFQKIDSKNTIFSACHTYRIQLIWLRVTSTCFIQSKKNSNGLSWLMTTNSLVILSGLDQQRLNTVFQAWVPRAQEVSESSGDCDR
jgi:hypothetical protein